jgi:hypothetical protein
MFCAIDGWQHSHWRAVGEQVCQQCPNIEWEFWAVIMRLLRMLQAALANIMQGLRVPPLWLFACSLFRMPTVGLTEFACQLSRCPLASAHSTSSATPHAISRCLQHEHQAKVVGGTLEEPAIKRSSWDKARTDMAIATQLALHRRQLLALVEDNEFHLSDSNNSQWTRHNLNQRMRGGCLVYLQHAAEQVEATTAVPTAWLGNCVKQCMSQVYREVKLHVGQSPS